jgi:4-hydroxyphenylpyruvate dioxygenase
LVYFVPSDVGAKALFETDFDFEELDETPDANAPRYVDHLAFALPVDQLDTWVLFCRAVLGMQPGDSLELSDPYGLIRSAGVANADRSVRLVLNVSLSQRTRTARAVSTTEGSVHHVALGVDDIFAAVSGMRAAGVGFVPISPNYYDDLLARLDIGADLVERMRSSGVLYDRSTGGEYLHTYGNSFAGKFFFEIVQRIGPYDAYGALNAPARMTSQAQSDRTI